MDSLDFIESSYNIPLNYEREYIYNTKSGSLLRLDSGETLAKLCEDEKTFDYLLDNGFVTNVDERAGLRFKHCTAQNDQTYLHFTIFITLDCNFNCYYCYEHKTQKTLSNSNIDKLLSYIEKEYGKGKIKRLHITWMGGEPLLEHKKIVSISSRIITLSKNYSVRYTASLVTNGFFLATCESNFISSTQINEIQLTFDGPENYHNIVKNTHNPNDPHFQEL